MAPPQPGLWGMPQLVLYQKTYGYGVTRLKTG